MVDMEGRREKGQGTGGERRATSDERRPEHDVSTRSVAPVRGTVSSEGALGQLVVEVLSKAPDVVGQGLDSAAAGLLKQNHDLWTPGAGAARRFGWCSNLDVWL